MNMDNVAGYSIEKRGGHANASAESYSQYKTLFEQVNAAALLTTLSGNILQANIKSHDLFGYDFDEFKDITLRQLFPLNTDWTQFIDEIAAKGGLRLETEIVRKDGALVPVEINSSIFAVDNIPQMLTLIQDITDRKIHDQRLKESEQKYRSLFESTSDGMIILDGRGEICDMNGQALNFLNLKKEAVINQNLLNLGVFPPSAISIILHQFEMLLNDEQPSSHETELKKNNAELFDAEISSFFLCKKENEVDHFVIVIRDTKEHNHVQQDLTQTQKRLRLLLDNIPLMVYFKDCENRFVLVNNAQAKQFNATPEEMIGKTEFDFLPSDAAKPLSDEDNKVIINGQSILDQQRLLSLPYGGTCEIIITKIPQYDETGQPNGVISISQVLEEHPEYE
jgi:PAS domain S-box-containing protein